MKIQTKKIYLAIFAIFALFNGNFALRKMKSETKIEKVSRENPQKSHERLDALNSLAAVTADSESKSSNLGLFGSTLGNEPFKDVKVTKIADDQSYTDIAVNSEGQIVTIGIDGSLLEYKFATDEWEEIKGDIDISNLYRVDVGYDGIIYVVTRCGDTYYLTCDRKWIKLPGCAIDIGAGRGDEIYKIGCHKDKSMTNYCKKGETSDKIDDESPFVFRLICKCDCRCCRRGCKKFVKFTPTCEHDLEKKQCFWLKLPNNLTKKSEVRDSNGLTASKIDFIEFTRIDVDFSGFPIVTDEKNIYKFVGGDKNVFKKVFDLDNKDETINDIAGDNYGNIFFITNKNSYILVRGKDDYEKAEPLNKSKSYSGFNISVGPYAQPTFTDSDCHIKTTAKQIYN